MELHDATCPADEALERLRRGNARFLEARGNDGCISAELREKLAGEGQQPYAAVLSCADSRVVPEHAFMVGLGELFSVRVAGNVAGDTQVASIVYAVKHLGVRLVVVMGHTGCGAVGAALAGVEEPCIDALVAPIDAAIGERRHDERAATVANVQAAVARLERDDVLAYAQCEADVRIVGALYHTATGEVEWLERT